MRAVGAPHNRAVRKGCHIGYYSTLRSVGPTPIVFIVFIGFVLFFLEGESKYFKRRDAKTQSFSFFMNTKCTKETKAFVYSVSSVVR